MDEYNENAEVYGYEMATKPESGIQAGCMEMVVSSIWIRQTDKRGAKEQVRSVTYRSPWGKENSIAIPYQEDYEVPEDMVSLEQLEFAIRQILEMKDK